MLVIALKSDLLPSKAALYRFHHIASQHGFIDLT